MKTIMVNRKIINSKIMTKKHLKIIMKNQMEIMKIIKINHWHKQMKILKLKHNNRKIINNKKLINKNKNNNKIIMKKNNIKKTIITMRKIIVIRNKMKFQIKKVLIQNNKKQVNCPPNSPMKAPNRKQILAKKVNQSFNSTTIKRIKNPRKPLKI